MSDFPRTLEAFAEAAKQFVRDSGGLLLEARVVLIPPEMEAVVDAWDEQERQCLWPWPPTPGSRAERIMNIRIVWDAPCFLLAWVPNEPL